MRYARRPNWQAPVAPSSASIGLQALDAATTVQLRLYLSAERARVIMTKLDLCGLCAGHAHGPVERVCARNKLTVPMKILLLEPPTGTKSKVNLEDLSGRALRGHHARL